MRVSNGSRHSGQPLGERDERRLAPCTRYRCSHALARVVAVSWQCRRRTAPEGAGRAAYLYGCKPADASSAPHAAALATLLQQIMSRHTYKKPCHLSMAGRVSVRDNSGCVRLA